MSNHDLISMMRTEIEDLQIENESLKNQTNQIAKMYEALEWEHKVTVSKLQSDLREQARTIRTICDYKNAALKETGDE